MQFYVKENNGRYRAVNSSDIAELLKRELVGTTITSPSATADYLRAELAGLEHEEFHAVYLNAQHAVICTERVFRGTIDGCAVYPREIVKAALQHNAAAVIIAHNHPSGIPEPSTADRRITDKLKEALALVDVRVLDHFVIGAGDYVSFSQHGWI